MAYASEGLSGFGDADLLQGSDSAERNRFFPLNILRQTKEHASLSTQLLRKLSFRLTQARSANRIFVKRRLPICARQLSYLQPPKMRPTAVLDYVAGEPGRPSTYEYPVDVQCILRVKAVGNGNGGEVPVEWRRTLPFASSMTWTLGATFHSRQSYGAYLFVRPWRLRLCRLLGPDTLVPRLNPHDHQHRGVPSRRVCPGASIEPLTKPFTLFGSTTSFDVDQQFETYRSHQIPYLLRRKSLVCARQIG